MRSERSSSRSRTPRASHVAVIVYSAWCSYRMLNINKVLRRPPQAWSHLALLVRPNRIADHTVFFSSRLNKLDTNLNCIF
jgi:hypothetical protein